MLPIFTLTIFVSAGLLFLVQPMVAKMLLPLLGGSPAVWNTCMVFFQGVLLAGYLYAHLLTRHAGRRAQVAIHACVVLGALLLLPMAVPAWDPPAVDFPALWLLAALTATAGGPFFVVSTSAPLLQRWFSATAHRSAHDPYFLYAASNAGSMLALLSYPVLVEPSLRLADQSRLWAWLFAGLGVLLIACGVVHARRARPAALVISGEARDIGDPAQAAVRSVPIGIPRLTRVRWVLLAFVPSSLMLAVTYHLTTDVAAVPLLWVLPLAIYLLTFIVGFARGTGPLIRAASLATILLAPLVAYAYASESTSPARLFIPLHLVFLFAAGLLCHGRLAMERPHTAHLTQFYLLIAIGGVLGGIFNALAAPLLFNTLAEYPIAIVLACLLRLPLPPALRAIFERRRSLALRSVLWLVPVAPVLLAIYGVHLAAYFRLSPGVGVVMVYAVPLGVCALVLPFRAPYVVALAAALAALSLRVHPAVEMLHKERTFFGIHRVTEEFAARRVLSHGTTRHGIQLIHPRLRYMPTSYYHPSGPIGQVFGTFGGDPEFDQIAIVGLGAGALAGYGVEGQTLTFYEIDPAVRRIATNPDLFTFIHDSDARIEFDMGDARLRLKDAPDGLYDMIVLDAFTSDAVPVHLLTREAIELYMTKLTPRGLLALHTSNRFLDLPQVLGATAVDLGLAAYLNNDARVSPEQQQEGKDRSIWVVLVRDPANMGPLARAEGWQRFAPLPTSPRWTDDYSNLLRIFRWGQ